MTRGRKRSENREDRIRRIEKVVRATSVVQAAVVLKVTNRTGELVDKEDDQNDRF